MPDYYYMISGELDLIKYKNVNMKYYSKDAQLMIRLACEFWMNTATLIRRHDEYKKYSAAHLKGRIRECEF